MIYNKYYKHNTFDIRLMQAMDDAVASTQTTTSPTPTVDPSKFKASQFIRTNPIKGNLANAKVLHTAMDYGVYGGTSRTDMQRIRNSFGRTKQDWRNVQAAQLFGSEYDPNKNYSRQDLRKARKMMRLSKQEWRDRIGQTIGKQAMHNTLYGTNTAYRDYMNGQNLRAAQTAPTQAAWKPGNGYTFNLENDINGDQAFRLSKIYSKNIDKHMWKDMDAADGVVDGKITSAGMNVYSRRMGYEGNPNNPNSINFFKQYGIDYDPNEHSWVTDMSMSDYYKTSKYDPTKDPDKKKKWSFRHDKNGNLVDWNLKDDTEFENYLKASFGIGYDELGINRNAGNAMQQVGEKVNVNLANGFTRAHDAQLKQAIWNNPNMKYQNTQGKRGFYWQSPTPTPGPGTVVANKKGGIIKAQGGLDFDAINASYKQDLEKARRAAAANAARKKAEQDAALQAEQEDLDNQVNSYIDQLNKFWAKTYANDKKSGRVKTEEDYKTGLYWRTSTLAAPELFSKLNNSSNATQYHAKINNAKRQAVDRNWNKYLTFKNRDAWAKAYGFTGDAITGAYDGAGNDASVNFETKQAVIGGTTYNIIDRNVTQGIQLLNPSTGRYYKLTYNPGRMFRSQYDVSPIAKPSTQNQYLKDGGSIKKFQNPSGPIIEDYSNTVTTSAPNYALGTAVGAGAAGAVGAGTAYGIYRHKINSMAKKILDNSDIFDTRSGKLHKDAFEKVNNAIKTSQSRIERKAAQKILKQTNKNIAKKAAEKVSRDFRSLGKPSTLSYMSLLDIPYMAAQAWNTIRRPFMSNAEKKELDAAQASPRKFIPGFGWVNEDTGYAQAFDKFGDGERVYKQGGQLNKFQQGGTMEQNNQEQLLTYATLGLIGYANANQKPMDFTTAVQQVMQMAEQKPEALQEIAENKELIQMGVDILKQQEPEVLQMISQPGGMSKVISQVSQKAAQVARHGAKLNFIQDLKGMCPDGYEPSYMKAGGKVCKICKKKMQKLGRTIIGNEIPAGAHGMPIIQGGISSLMNSIKADLFKKGGKTRKCTIGGEMPDDKKKKGTRDANGVLSTTPAGKDPAYQNAMRRGDRAAADSILINKYNDEKTLMSTSDKDGKYVNGKWVPNRKSSRYVKK